MDIALDEPVAAEGRIIRLEEETTRLRTELEELKLAFAQFRSQF
jgi:hypothetical protein